MNAPRRFRTALRAARQLGARQAAWWALYQGGLRTGLWRRLTPPVPNQPLPLMLHAPFSLPDRKDIETTVGTEQAALLQEADEITAGLVRLFGGAPVALRLVPAGPLHHWTGYETGRAPWGAEDVKFLWEPARFGWVYPLGRAYLLTGRPEYAAAFWRNFRQFLHANPPNLGPNWASGQEVALRLVALLFAARAFEGSPESTPGNLALLAGAVAQHAQRIPPTLCYARAQHNNHLVSEGLGLYFAGLALAAYPPAARWQALGWKTLCAALESQIAPDGVYAQHSVNYHRLMLQAALLGALPGRDYPQPVRRRLAAATEWLLAQIDPDSGQAPNYGSNDGAYIFPLAPGGFGDYRPVAQAAARAFTGRSALPPGPWDELCLWLGVQRLEGQVSSPRPGPTAGPTAGSTAGSTAIHRLGQPGDWAVLRAARYTSRPSHADQLHLDLWHQGVNVALDAGTYRYSAPPPHENALRVTRVHNTVEVDGLDQMRPAGRFLWLDWAQATARAAENLLEGCHTGYDRLGVRHCRRVQRIGRGQWLVQDQLHPVGPATRHSFRLHWLLPDWPWTLEGAALTLEAPWGGKARVALAVDSPPGQAFTVALVRAGKALAGECSAALPVDGWASPTYNTRVPALSFSIRLEAMPPVILDTRWDLTTG